MRKVRLYMCMNEQPHERHSWRPLWSIRKQICSGVELTHRHTFKVARVLVTPAGFPVTRDRVYWQCQLWLCGEIWSKDREELRTELLGPRPELNQAWPN